jgi:hypothetical protein
VPTSGPAAGSADPVGGKADSEGDRAGATQFECALSVDCPVREVCSDRICAAPVSCGEPSYEEPEPCEDCSDDFEAYFERVRAAVMDQLERSSAVAQAYLDAVYADDYSVQHPRFHLVEAQYEVTEALALAMPRLEDTIREYAPFIDDTQLAMLDAVRGRRGGVHEVVEAVDARGHLGFEVIDAMSDGPLPYSIPRDEIEAVVAGDACYETSRIGQLESTVARDRMRLLALKGLGDQLLPMLDPTSLDTTNIETFWVDAREALNWRRVQVQLRMDDVASMSATRSNARHLLETFPDAVNSVVLTEPEFRGVHGEIYRSLLLNQTARALVDFTLFLAPFYIGYRVVAGLLMGAFRGWLATSYATRTFWTAFAYGAANAKPGVSVGYMALLVDFLLSYAGVVPGPSQVQTTLTDLFRASQGPWAAPDALDRELDREEHARRRELAEGFRVVVERITGSGTVADDAVPYLADALVGGR